MKLDFVKNTKRNAIAYFVSQCVATVLPFLRKTLFLWILGSEYLGLNGLFFSILGMLMLSEMGFGEAIVCYMYKPVAEDNNELICAYLRFFKKVYQFVGAFIFISGLCVMPFLRHFIHGHIPADVNLYILYLMFLLKTAIGYFFFAYRGAVFAAQHRGDITTYIGIATGATEFLLSCVVLCLTHNYYYYVWVLIGCALLNNISVMIASRKYYPEMVPRGKLPQQDIKRIISDVKAIFMHKIGTVMFNSFDTLVISSFLGLTAVASFGSYGHIKGSVGAMAGGLCYSMLGGFGNKIYTESKEENFMLLMKAHRLLMCIILWGGAMLLALYQPFMIIWTKNDPTLIRHFLTPLLMVIWFYEMQSRETLRMFKNAAALWQPDKWKAVVAGIANLVLNLTFINVFPDEYKLDGVILATLLTDIFIQMPWESYAVFTAFFGRKEAVQYWRQQAIYMLLAVLFSGATWGAAYAIPLSGVQGFFVKSIVAFTVSLGLLLAVFRDDALAVLKKVIFRKKGGA
jgi:O-antigen/teichoic acid export membrane protein